MKTAIIVYQNAAEEGGKALDGRTLLQSARARAASELACRGCGGWMVSPTYSHSLLAQACGLSADRADQLRRGTLEARLLDHAPATGDMVYGVDLVAEDRGVICSIPAPSIQETGELAEALNQGLGESYVRFECLEGGALVLMLTGVNESLPEGLPTDQVLGQDRVEVMPTGRGAARLRELMIQAGEILSRHPVNEIRLDLGEDPANGIWLHGGGRWPDAAGSRQPTQSMAMLTESRVGRGIAHMLDLPALRVRRTAGDEKPWFHLPDLVSALHHHDSLIVDVMLRGDGEAVDRVRQLDRIDQQVLAPLLDILQAHRPYRIVLVAAAPESAEADPSRETLLPLVVSGDDLQPDVTDRWDEAACLEGVLGQVDLAPFMRELRNQAE